MTIATVNNGDMIIMKSSRRSSSDRILTFASNGFVLEENVRGSESRPTLPQGEGSSML